jgi:hypothetical protein
MSLFHLDWFVCRDGYRLEERRSPRRTRRSGGSRLVIVPNSNAWVPSKPLDSPGLYRQLGACDLGGPEEILRFIEYNGLLFRAKAPKEELVNVIEYISGMRRLLAAIDRSEWRSIADALNRPGRDELFPIRGVGRLTIVFDVPNCQRALPSLKLRPANLAEGLQVQALADASGVIHDSLS